MLRAEGISKTYRRRTFFSRQIRDSTRALVNVSVSFAEGSTTAVVGRSGSGKSTLARCLSGLELPDAGDVLLSGKSLLKREEIKARSCAVQLVFQDSGMSFNPWMNVLDIATEGLAIRGATERERRAACLRLLDQVELPALTIDRPARELSGGERNRLAIARALCTDPAVLILDEVSAGLDWITRSRLFTLLRNLQRERSLTCVLITHDLRAADEIAGCIVVLEAGAVVEYGSTKDVLRQPRHEMTKALIRAVSDPQSFRAFPPRVLPC